VGEWRRDQKWVTLIILGGPNKGIETGVITTPRLDDDHRLYSLYLPFISSNIDTFPYFAGSIGKLETHHAQGEYALWRCKL